MIEWMIDKAWIVLLVGAILGLFQLGFWAAVSLDKAAEIKAELRECRERGG